MAKIAIIIGAGPAGLTAALELLRRTDILPIILEKSEDIGGISKTINYKGNRIDVGGHRFFSKSDKVMQWWLNIMPIEPSQENELSIYYQNKEMKIVPSKTQMSTGNQKTMLVRPRVSRIYYLRKFFSYPITISLDTFRKLGLVRISKILSSYAYAKLFPPRELKTMEDFFIRRFGKTLYLTFFKDYTEKVWGVPCSDLPAEWGAQRIKELSVTKAVLHAIRKRIPFGKSNDIAQKDIATTLIQKFLYPRHGPGEMWEEVARLIQAEGGIIHLKKDVKKINIGNDKVISIEASDNGNAATEIYQGDYFFSTMAVKDLIHGMGSQVPVEVTAIANGLQYRDFITVGLLVRKLKPKGNNRELINDTWIYIQEKDVKVGRIQIFNNWSPFMVKDADTVWLGLEYFCNREDLFWQMQDEAIIQLAIDELIKINIIDAADVIDHTIIRMEKTYPSYFGTYNKFDRVKSYTDNFKNLFLIGRNGMHKYNNADHSMLTAMTAVDNIISNRTDKTNIWNINTEQEYHE